MITARTGSASLVNCPTCPFIRERADRADQREMIALSVDEVAELRAVMREGQ